MIITLKSIQKGLYKLQIRKEKGEIEYKDVQPNMLHSFLMDLEFQCDLKKEKFTFLMNAQVKKYVGAWIENHAAQHNNNDV